MFLRKNNPYRDRSSGRFTFGPGGSVSVGAPTGLSYGDAYTPARVSIENPDGTLNVEAAEELAAVLILANANPRIAELRGQQDKALIVGREYQGFNGKPHLASPTDFDALPGDTFYRGDTSPKHTDQIKTGKFYGGSGMHGNGTYTAQNPSYALMYTVRDPVKPPSGDGGFLRYKMHPESRIASREDMRAAGMRTTRNLEAAYASGRLDEGQVGVLRTYFRDPGRLALARGYDAYVPDHDFGQWGKVVVVLNRTAMVIADEPSLSADALGTYGLPR